MKKRILALLLVLMLVFSTLCGCELLDSFMSGGENGGSENGGENGGSEGGESGGESPEVPSVGDLGSVPPFDGTRKYIIINDNVPFFEDEKRDGSYESFSELDSLGRCGVAIACIGRDLMPTEDRDDIGHVRPSGWHSVEYDVVPGGNLYNRCHLIGFQLTGENDNEKNLITGTRDMNNEAMLPFENKVANYVRDTGNHVLYRVTPIFEGTNLVANGVLMEALSVEDNGEGIKFCIYAYNVQPGVTIDYFTGVNVANGEELPEIDTDDGRGEIADGGDKNEDTSNGDGTQDGEGSDGENGGQEGGNASGGDNGSENLPTDCDYVLNTNSKKFHLPGKSCANSISDKNREEFFGTREELIEDGYEPCKICKP